MTLRALLRGFSLLEIVISIGIIGIALVASEALVHAVPLARQTNHEDLALTIATNEMGALRSLGYGSLPSSGSFSDPLLTSLPSGAGMLAISAFNAKTKQASVTVSWQEPGSAARSIVLSTLVTETGGL